MTLHALIQYIRYKLKAKTRHGIHSPFVYAFIDNCLAKKSAQNLEERINAYFGDGVYWVDDATNIKQHTIIAIRNIHSNKQCTAMWDVLRGNQSYIISIDLYSIGLLVKNPDIKEKQHFVLQYPL